MSRTTITTKDGADLLVAIREATRDAGRVDLTLPSCDICGERIETGERYTHDPKGETTHNDCARDWFRRNFGRESL